MERRVRLLHGRMGAAPSGDPLLGLLNQVTTADGVLARVASTAPAAETGKDTSRISRSEGLWNGGWMRRRKVLLVGGGRIGVPIGLELAPYGIGQILVDHDVVEAANVLGAVTPYGPEDIGLPKVIGLKAKVLARDPAANVVIHPRNIHDFTDAELVRLAEQVDVAVIAIDDGPALLRLNRIFHPRVLTYYPAAHEEGRTGQIIITRPPEMVGSRGTPCLACCLGTRSGSDIETLHGEPGLGVDFATISHVCARLVVRELAAKWGSPLGPALGPDVSVLFISNGPSEFTPQGPGIVLFRVERDPDCEVCGNGQGGR